MQSLNWFLSGILGGGTGGGPAGVGPGGFGPGGAGIGSGGFGPGGQTLGSGKPPKSGYGSSLGGTGYRPGNVTRKENNKYKRFYILMMLTVLTQYCHS